MRKKIIICSLFCFFLMNICFLFLSNEILHAYADDITAINFEQNDNNWSDIVEPGIEVNSADKAATATLITGANDDNFTEIARKEDLTDVKYINNASYFLANPKHHENYANNPDNAAGTCTTVAMQMLIGYHNYYTDRRLIPETNGDSVRFLCSDYGNLLDNPIINHTMEAEQGRASIGTEDTVYREIYNLTWISDWYGIGQALGLVKDGAVQFINRYSTISNNVSFIKSDFQWMML